MSSREVKTNPVICLALAALLYLFSNGKWAILIAAWLAPVFLVRFIRGRKAFLGLLEDQFGSMNDPLRLFSIVEEW